MTTLQEAARKALASLELYDYEDLASCEARHELRTALAQQGATKNCPQPEICGSKECEFCRDTAAPAPQAQQGEPVAWLKEWVSVGYEGKETPLVRIDATPGCERWLERLNPRITPLIKAAPAPQPAQGAVTRRKIFVCAHCDGIYADQTVTQCDCMEGTGADFVEGFAEYPAVPQSAQPAPQPAQDVTELVDALEYAIKQVPELATVPGIHAALSKYKGAK